MERSHPEGGTSSLAKGLEVLTAVVDSGPQRADEIAARTGIPLSSVYRFVRTLVSTGLLQSSGGVYHIGPRLRRGADEQDRTAHLREIAQPVLRWLVDQTEETALLTVRTRLHALVVESEDSFHPMKVSFTRGQIRPLHAGASAKILLAYAPEPVLKELLAAGLERYTASTPTKRRLPKQLEDIRSQQYSITVSEVDLHAVGVGVPVFLGGELICALSVVGPEHRYEAHRIPKLLQALQEAAGKLEERLAAGKISG